MNKYIFGFIAVAAFSPLLASADTGSSACWQTDPVTCKEVTITQIISLDPALAKDYYLGTHYPICVVWGMEGCYGGYTRYSESLFLTSSTTLSENVLSPDGVDTVPTEAALFDKKFFTPLLSKQYARLNVPFSANAFPPLTIDVLMKSEVDAIYTKEFSFGETTLNASTTVIMDKLDKIDPERDFLHKGPYHMNTLNYKGYGPYIHAPKGDLTESQYVDLELAPKLPTNSDLQISIIKYGHWDRATGLAIPLTSPLKEVRNYWLYTKKNEKLVLAWQKREYLLDTGTVKTVTAADTNASAAFLFGETPATTTVATTSASAVLDDKKGFFSSIINWILSWFR